MRIIFLLISIVSFGFFQAPAVDPTDIGPVLAVVTARALMLAAIVKPLVDAIALAWLKLAGPIIPFVAMLIAGILDVLFMLVLGQPFTGKNVGLMILTAIVAGLGAKIITDVHSGVRPA